MEADNSEPTAKPRAIARDWVRGGGATQPGAATTVFGWALSLLVVAVAARVSLGALHAADNPRWTPISPWFAIAFLAEDLTLVAVFAVLVAVLDWFSRVHPSHARAATIAIGAVHALLAFWMALNIPVARFFSTPLTYSFLHATGSALGDSIAGYATLPNLAMPIGVCGGGLAFARWVRPRLHPSRRLILVAALAALGVLAIGPTAVRRVDTLGLHRNAVVALFETTLSRWFSRQNDVRPSLASPACIPRAGRDADKEVSPTVQTAPDQSGGSASAPLSDLVGLARGRSVVWVILESTGARALTTYGALREAMPHVNELARQAVIFENAYTAYPESIKGLFSVLCSREPPTHSEASDYAVGKVPCRSIAEEMAQAGFRTGLFHSGWFAYLGMRAVVEGRGFHELHDAGTIASRFRTSFGVDDRATADRLLAFVDSTPRGRPFFAVFMPIAGHHPYHAPGDALRPFPDLEDRDAHANDIHAADDAFGRLRDGLRARGRDDQVVYVVFGDHGEAFREHDGNIAHALFLYEENVRVPLLIAAPGMMNGERRIRDLASLIDLAPTTLTLAGRRVPQKYEGQSLLDARPRMARFSTEQGVRRAGLRDGPWKFILDEESGRPQLFDLASDPDERLEHAAAHAERVRHYRGCLGR